MGEFNEPRWARLKQGHTVVKTGVYRYLRHPQYASKMLAYLGLFLFFKDFLFLLVFFCSVLLFYLQAKSEEKLLIQVFGEEYKNYQATSGMFLPLVFRRWIRQVPKQHRGQGQKPMINAFQTNGSLRLDSGSYRQHHLGEDTKRARLTQFKATLKN